MFGVDLLIFSPFLFWILGINFFIYFTLQISAKSSNLMNNFFFSFSLIQINFYFVLLSSSWDNFCSIYLFNNGFILSYSNYLLQLILISFFCLFLILVKNYMITKRNFSFEIYIFLLFSLFGLLIILLTSDFVLFFLGFELQAFSLYAIASYKNNSLLTNEAVIKYFLFGALFSSLLILGFSFVYGFFGSLNLIELNFMFWKNDFMLSFSFLLVTCSFLFKLGLAPFHQWVAEIYEGVDSLVTMFFSFFPKISLLIFLNQLFLHYFFISLNECSNLFFYLSLISIFIGSFFSLSQIKIKRLLAFSSVAQIGYLVLMLSNVSQDSFFSIATYLLIYSLTIIQLWSNILFYQRENFLFINDFIGFSRKNFWLSLNFSIIFLSLAGMPPMAGFVGKLLIFTKLLDDSYLVVLFFLLILSAFSVLYYLNLIYISFFKNLANYHFNKLYLNLRKTISSEFFITTLSNSILFILLFSFLNLNWLTSLIFEFTLIFIN